MYALSAPIPRRLRVRASVQLGTTRVSARAFLLAVGLLLVGALAITLGAALTPTVQRLGGLLIIGLALLEGRLWGRSTLPLAAILLRHLRRPRRLRRPPLLITLPADGPRLAPARRPRWQDQKEN